MSASRPVLEAMLTRRSIRSGFTDESVGRTELERIVACGLAAPSSKNAQPWRFHVVTNPALRGALADAVAAAEGAQTYVPHDPRTGRPYPQYSSTVAESAQTVRVAPAAIWIENLGPFSAGRQALLSASPEGLAGSLEGYGFELIGIGAALENLWVATTALGMAAAFVGDVVIAEPLIRELIGLDGDLAGAFVLGYSEAVPRPPMDARALPDVSRVVWH